MAAVTRSEDVDGFAVCSLDCHRSKTVLVQIVDAADDSGVHGVDGGSGHGGEVDAGVEPGGPLAVAGCEREPIAING